MGFYHYEFSMENFIFFEIKMKSPKRRKNTEEAIDFLRFFQSFLFGVIHFVIIISSNTMESTNTPSYVYTYKHRCNVRITVKLSANDN